MVKIKELFLLLVAVQFHAYVNTTRTYGNGSSNTNADNNAWEIIVKLTRINGQISKNSHRLYVKNALSPQIIGGDYALPEQFPWYGRLEISTKDNSGAYMCGSSLISPMFAISACHCVMDLKLFNHYVHLGSIYISDTTKKFVPNPQCHENYDRNTLKNDISILQFESPVTLTSFIRPVTLPRNKDFSFVGKLVSVSGFGRISDENNELSSALKYANLTVTPDSSCSVEYGINSYFPDVMLCARAAARDQADCNGDSGGGLIYFNSTDQTWIKIGIVSWGGVSCLGTSSVYTRVSAFVEWIDKKIADSQGLQSTTTPPPPSTQCSSSNYQDITTCCKKSIGQLVSRNTNKDAKKAEITCKKNFKSTLNAFNVYKLYKLHDINNNIDFFNQAHLSRVIGLETCFVECVVREMNVIDASGAILKSGLAKLLLSNQNKNTMKTWKSLMNEMVHTCKNIVNSRNLTLSITVEGAKCKFEYYAIVQCVLLSIIEKCPDIKTSSTCKKAYKLFGECSKFVFQ